jgi:hypothetical protein
LDVFGPLVSLRLGFICLSADGETHHYSGGSLSRITFLDSRRLGYEREEGLEGKWVQKEKGPAFFFEEIGPDHGPWNIKQHLSNVQ